MRRSAEALRTALLLPVLATLGAGCAPAPAPVEPARPVLVAHPETVGAGATAYAGEVRPREESALAFRVGGNLVERRVDVGDHVRAGDLLAVLDPGDLQAQARAAQAQLSAAQAELGRARADQARFAQLGRDQLVSRSAIDAQNAAAAAAQGQVNAARANLDVARNQVAYGQLRAPRAGVIATRTAEAGQVVAPGQTVFTLAADGGREVAFAVAESVVDAVRPGQPVLVELWSQPGKRWPGRVREIAPAADPASRTYAARVVVDAPDGTFELGQSARVYLPQDGNGGLSVPLSALQRSGGGAAGQAAAGQGVAGQDVAAGAVAVFVVDPKTSTLALRPVRTGPYAQDRAPVLDGLAPGDWVVAAGGHLLRAGEKVRPVDRDNRPVPLGAGR